MLPLRRNIRKEGAGTWLQRKSAPIADIIIDSRFLDRNRCLNLRADVRIDHKFKVYQNLFTMTTFSPSLIIKTFNIWLDLNLTGYIAHFDVEIMINPALLQFILQVNDRAREPALVQNHILNDAIEEIYKMESEGYCAPDGQIYDVKVFVFMISRLDQERVGQFCSV